MAWITLTRTSLQTRFSKPELLRLPAEARAAGLSADDVLDEAVSVVVREIRGSVSTRNTLGRPGTIPDELENAALSKMVQVVISRLPGLASLMDETRRALVDQANDLLRRVESGSFSIVPPIEAGIEQARAVTPCVTRKKNIWRVEDQDGI